MTAATLRAYSVKDLAQMAKRRGLNGWNTMRKDQLVKALAKVAAKVAKRPAVSHAVVSRGTVARTAPAAASRQKSATKAAPTRRSAAPVGRAAQSLAVSKSAGGRTVATRGSSVRTGVVSKAATSKAATSKAVTSKAVPSKPAPKKQIAAKAVLSKSATSKTPTKSGLPQATSPASFKQNGHVNHIGHGQNGHAGQNGHGQNGHSNGHVSTNGKAENGKATRNGKNKTEPKPVSMKAIVSPVQKSTVTSASAARTVASLLTHGTSPLSNGHSNGKASHVPAPPRRVIKRLEQAKAQFNRAKSLAETTTGGMSNLEVPPAKDRLIVMVRGPFWLHAYWDLSGQGVQRAQVAMGQEWHTARPVLRLYQITNAGASSSSESVVRDIEVHGGVKNWFVDLKSAAQTYRMEIGYLSTRGRFLSLARSNVVTTPPAASGDSLDNHWPEIEEDCEKVYALSGGYSVEGASVELQDLFEERTRRPMGPPNASRYGNGAEGLLPRDRRFRFEIDAEMIIHGTSQPGAHVTMQGEPVKVQSDGSFHVRVDLPNRRQVIPIVASTKDGVEQRTVVLAVERNTKSMEPAARDAAE
ncbi:MAG: DUF4912 domain-containing protein [Planctomycetota bacterium]|nr:DUF4912 domain-containing protein [Planctomycetota bacterium]